MKNRYPRLSFLAISFFFSFSLSAQTFTGTLSLVDASGNSVSNYAAGSSLYVNVSDADRNVSATVADTVTVSVSSAKETTAETVVLTETGVNTGVFSASMSFDPTGAVAADGSLQVDAGDMITVNYTDPADDFGNSKLISATSFYGMTSITSGFIMSNTTWTKANSPYFLTGDVIVPDSVTLTIEPGAVIRFDGSDDLSSGEDQNRIEIRVSGSLKANGNATDSVYFISNAQNPAAGDWFGIVSYDANTNEQPSSYSGNWDKVGAVDLSYARVAHYIKGVSAYDYASQTVNGIYYGWGNSSSPDSIKVHNSVFQAGGDAYYCSEYWAFRPLEFVNNRVHNAGLYSYGRSSYKKVENNNFKSNQYTGGSGMSPFRIYVSGDQRNSSTPHRMLLHFKNNNIDFGYVEIYGSSEASTSVAQKSATIDVSGNTIHRNNSAKIYIRYYNYGLPLDSTKVKVSNNTIRGWNIQGEGLYIRSGSQGARFEISNNDLRGLNYGARLYSDQASQWLVENNTIDSTYYNGIYKENGSAKIIGNTIEHAGRYSWNGSQFNGVYLKASANYPGTDTLKNNTIRYNGNWNNPNSTGALTLGIGGVTIDGNVTAVINANNIYENNGHDVTNLVSKSVATIQDARYNYWGDSATVEMNTGANPKNISVIYDEYDDALKGFVNYAGYVDTLDGTPSALNVLGDLTLLNATGTQAFNYPQGDTLRVRVSDADRNVSTTVADTVTVSVSSAKETTAETVVLTETGVNTGVFSASMSFDPTGAVAADGSLQVDAGDMITVNYTDPADDFGNVQILTATSFYGMTEVTSGFIMSNTTWTKANSPYFLTGDVIVPDSVTLTIEPGVNVRFKAKSDDLSSGEDQNRIEIRVSGSLKANGNATDSVYFISNAQNPAAGDWFGIVSYDANTNEQPSSYSGNWDKVGAVDLSYARVAHYIKGVSAYDYASQTVNGIYYGWGNSSSPDSIKVHNSVFQAGGDAYYCSEYWAFRPLEFVNNRVHNAGLYSYGRSSYKKVENNNFKSNQYTGGSGMSPFRIYVSGDQRNSSTPHRMLLHFKNNNIDFGYVEIYGSSEASTSVAQKSATIDVSGNTIHRNNSAKIYIRYYNYGLPLDSTKVKVSNNTIRGWNIQGEGLYIRSGSQGARFEISNNDLRGLNYGARLYSDQASQWLVENNTIDSTYYNGIYKENGSAKIIGNTIEHAGRYSWNGSQFNGVYLKASANYPGTDTLKNNTIRYNGNWNNPNSTGALTLGIGGVTIDGNVTAVINANNIYENNGHDVTNLVSKSVATIQDAKYNYWGDSATVEMNTGANPKNISVIYDEYDDALKGFVNYAGYVDTLDGTPSALNVLGDLTLLNATGTQAFNYPQGDTLRVRVSDADRNVSTTVADTVTVSVSSAKETTAETVVLTETGVNTGVFSASMSFDPTGAVAADGSLQVDAGDMITVNYTDPADDFGNVQILTATSFYGMTEVTSGFIMSNTTWTKANSPYFLTGDVIVPDSVTLTIEPGVNVRFKAKSDDLSSGEDQNRIEIRVSGSLKANGNATDSVYFISNAQNPAAGDWFGIVSYDANTNEQPSSYSGNWDKVGAVDLSYARVAHYIKGVSAYDYASQTVNGIYYGWGNSSSPDSIKVHNSVFQAGGDAYYCSEYWAFRPLEFVNNRVHNAGLYSYGRSSYKKVENNNFKSNQYTGGSGMSPFRIYVSGDQRNSSTPHRMLLHFKNNNIDFGYVEIYGSSEASTSVAQKSATIDVSGNTIHRNNSAKIYIRYYNYGLPLDSTKVKVSNNTIRGWNIQGEGLYIRSGSQGARFEISNNDLRGLNYGARLYSDQASQWLVENNTIDSTYYNGIYKENGSAKIIGNTIEHAGRYSWNGSQFNGVYLKASANYPGTDTLKNNTIRYNGNWNNPNSTGALTLGIGGVTIDGNVTAVINANNIYENNGHDVTNLVSKSVATIQDAKYNYWGPTTTAEIANGANPKNITAIHDEYDDALKGFVNYGQSYSGIITKDLLPDSLFYGGDSILVETSNGTIGDWNNGVTNANQIELNGYEGQIKVTFDFFGDTIQDSSYVMNLDTLYVSKIQADSLVGPIPGGNGSTGNMFNIINTSGQPLEITGFSQGPASGNNSASNVTIQVYSTPGDYRTQSSSSWTQVGTAVTNLTANATTGYCSISPVTIPAGATYGFYVGRASGSVQYTNGVGTAGVTTWFSNSALTVTEGLGGGYPNPTNNPRCWNGTVHYGDPNGVKINARPEAMFSQIQEAIDASDTSDVILVGPGVYNPFNIDNIVGPNYGKNLWIEGLDSLNRPVISGHDSVRAAEVIAGGVTLKHLSFRNGFAGPNTQYNNQRGGLLYAWDNTVPGSEIKVISCDFKDGYAPQGGDYYAGGGNLTFINCEFLKNDSLKNTMIHVDNGMWANFYNTLFDVDGYTDVLCRRVQTHRIYNSTIVNLIRSKLYSAMEPV
jgi:phage gp46-like protein